MEDAAKEKMIAKIEGAVIIVCLGMLIIGLLLAGGYARRERRDGKVKEELRSMKTGVEMYYNEHEKYPEEWEGGEYNYVVTQKFGDDVAGWFVSGTLENATEPMGGFDAEYNVDWRVTAGGRYEICGGVEVCGEKDNE